MKKLNILTGKQESDDYPYGRLRCHITFDIEFSHKKGFRFVTQTTNPKTGRINNPKKSTYSHFQCLVLDENEHVKHVSFSINGYQDIENFIKFLTINEVTFTNEQSEYLWMIVIACVRANANYTRFKEGGVHPFLDALSVSGMVSNLKARADFNQIKHIGYDLELAKTFRADS